MTSKKSEGGFTLIELLMASLLGSLLIISAFGMLYDSIAIADVLRSRAQVNAAARESFSILLDGGISNGVIVHGLRGRAAHPEPAQNPVLSDIANNNFRVRLVNGQNPEPNPVGILLGPTVSPHNIRCNGEGSPIPACPNAGEVLAVNGFLAGELRIYFDHRSINNKTRELEMTLTNPYTLNRPDVTAIQSVEIYRTIFNLYAD
jgi:prepilin-type N-terminal cleavage/methylation domain-containing protein